MENKKLVKQAKDTIELALVLLKDNGDWNHVYGLIDMAESLELLTKSEASDYKVAADDMRKRCQNG